MSTPNYNVIIKLDQLLLIYSLFCYVNVCVKMGLLASIVITSLYVNCGLHAHVIINHSTVQYSFSSALWASGSVQATRKIRTHVHYGTWACPGGQQVRRAQTNPGSSD